MMLMEHKKQDRNWKLELPAKTKKNQIRKFLEKAVLEMIGDKYEN